MTAPQDERRLTAIQIAKNIIELHDLVCKMTWTTSAENRQKLLTDLEAALPKLLENIVKT